MTIVLYSHTDASGVLLSSGWKLAIYRNSTANYLLFKESDTLMCCYGFFVFFTCFWTGTASVVSTWDLICFQMVHFVGMPVMYSDVLQNSMHGVC